MTLPIQEDQETAVRKGASTNETPPSVQVESPCRNGRSGGGERILDVVVAKVNAKNSLQDVLRWDLTLVQDGPVLGPASLGSKVRLGDSTGEDSEGTVWS